LLACHSAGTHDRLGEGGWVGKGKAVTSQRVVTPTREPPHPTTESFILGIRGSTIVSCSLSRLLAGSGEPRKTTMLGWRTAMAGLLFIVSRTKPGTHAYMKLVSDSEDIVLFDRRKGDRRRSHEHVANERR